MQEGPRKSCELRYSRRLDGVTRSPASLTGLWRKGGQIIDGWRRVPVPEPRLKIIARSIVMEHSVDEACATLTAQCPPIRSRTKNGRRRCCRLCADLPRPYRGCHIVMEYTRLKGICRLEASTIASSCETGAGFRIATAARIGRSLSGHGGRGLDERVERARVWVKNPEQI